jgi:hypothetical protein
MVRPGALVRLGNVGNVDSGPIIKTTDRLVVVSITRLRPSLSRRDRGRVKDAHLAVHGG